MNQIDQSPIIQAGIANLQAIVRAVQRLGELRPDATQYPGPPYCIVSNGEIPTLIEQICHWQASAFGCLFDSGSRHGESPRLKNLRLKRINLVRRACQGLALVELANRGFRNAVAHFDDYLLKELADHPDSSTIQDLSVSHEGVFNFTGRVSKIRYYVFETDTVHLFNKVLHPFALSDEARSVLDRFELAVARNG